MLTAPPTALRFGAAGPADDAALRALLRAMPMGNNIRVTFEREPSYFGASGIQGSVEVPVCRDADGNILGMGLRAFAPGWLDGERAEVGYLGDLRLVPGRRGGMLVARGYKHLRELHRDGRAKVYATMLVADNARALSTIAAGRAGLPAYRDLGLYLAPAILPRRCAPPSVQGLSVVRGSPELLEDIVASLNEFGRARQFAPRHCVEDFLPGGRWKGLRLCDFRLALRGGKVVGTLARWDQRAFRQTRVHGYSPLFAAARFFVNPFWKGLPAPGQTVPSVYAAFPSASDPAVLRHLIDALRAEPGDALYFNIGLSERDPLAAALQGLPRVPFAGRLFAVHYEEGAVEAGRIAQGIPYLEAGAL